MVFSISIKELRTYHGIIKHFIINVDLAGHFLKFSKFRNLYQKDLQFN